LLGRGVAGFLAGTISVFIAILIGVLFLHIEIEVNSINWPLFLVTLGIGINMLALLGLILAGVLLLLVHHMWGIGEAVAGSLYLFSGAIFPLEVLPPWLRWIGYLMPVTYWLELLRRSLVGQIAQSFPTLSSFSNNQLLLILLGLTIAFAVIASFSFRFCENHARNRGVIDVVTNY
jgi:ABC-2 type transport system permease protein